MSQHDSMENVGVSYFLYRTSSFLSLRYLTAFSGTAKINRASELDLKKSATSPSPCVPHLSLIIWSILQNVAMSERTLDTQKTSIFKSKWNYLFIANTSKV